MNKRTMSLSQEVWHGFVIRAFHRLKTGATRAYGIGSKTIIRGHRTGMVLMAVWTLGIVGCRTMADPSADAVVRQSPTTTPSVEGAWAIETTRGDLRRPFEVMELPVGDGTVTHGPLYFEDPDEEADGDDQFAWTAQDYLRLFNWRGRFLYNLALFPVSVVVTPPWMWMASDGYPSRKVFGTYHDAEPQTDRMVVSESSDDVESSVEDESEAVPDTSSSPLPHP